MTSNERHSQTNRKMDKCTSDLVSKQTYKRRTDSLILHLFPRYATDCRDKSWESRSKPGLLDQTIEETNTPTESPLINRYLLWMREGPQQAGAKSKLRTM